MPNHPRRPRLGRLLDVIVVTLLFGVFAGLAVYHYRRLDGLQAAIHGPWLMRASSISPGSRPRCSSLLRSRS